LAEFIRAAREGADRQGCLSACSQLFTLQSSTVLHWKLLLLGVADSKLHATFLASPAGSFCSRVCKSICAVLIGTAQAAALTLLMEAARSGGKDNTRTCRKPRPTDILCSCICVNYYISTTVICHLGEETEYCLP